MTQKLKSYKKDRNIAFKTWALSEAHYCENHSVICKQVYKQYYIYGSRVSSKAHKGNIFDPQTH